MKSILITGASRGVGRAIALKVAKSDEYSHIILNAHNNSNMLNETAEQITKLNPSVKCFTSIGNVGDINYISQLHSDITSFLSVLNDSSESHPALDSFSDKVSNTNYIHTLINNAALSYTGLLIDMTPDEWNETISTNLSSIYNTCHVFLPDMIANKSGKIINISSVWGSVGASCEAAYSATKGGVNSLTKALAKELAPSGIQVNALALGIVDTDMNSHLTKEEINEICDDIPIGRMMSPEEAAEGVMAILNAPDYLTGEIIKMDGGWI